MSFRTPDKRELHTAYVTDYRDIDRLATTGSLWTWGNNNVGQLATGNVTARSSPGQTISTANTWSQICISSLEEATGSNTHVMAVKTDGTLWGWGNASYGMLGNNVNTGRYSSPVQVTGGGTTWKQVDCGVLHSAAVKTDGTLWSWGDNSVGQLADNTVTNRSSPVQTVAAGTNWKEVSCGNYYTIALKNDGTLWTWGINTYGQLGDNSRTHRSSPTQIAGSWKSCSAAAHTSAAISDSGRLFTWGRNDYGQLGDNTRNNKSLPAETVAGGSNWKQVNVGTLYMSAIKTDGTLWSWGTNNVGELGDGTNLHKSSAVQVVTGGTNWRTLGLNKGRQSTAIKTDGTLWTWGYGVHGNNISAAALGYNSPIQTISPGTNWKQVATGGGNISLFYEAELCAAAIWYNDANKIYPPS